MIMKWDNGATVGFLSTNKRTSGRGRQKESKKTITLTPKRKIFWTFHINANLKALICLPWWAGIESNYTCADARIVGV